MFKLIAALLVALVAGCSQSVDETKIPLTEAELKFIASHPTIAWAMEANRPPWIFVEGGKPSGLAPDYLNLIAKKTGLKFKPVPTEGLDAGVDALRSGKVDVLTTIRPTPTDAKFMGFTPPFAYQGGVFVFRVNTLPRSPMTTGLIKSSAAKEYLQTRFPEMNLIETVDDEQSISLLQKGLLDGAITDTGSAAYLTAMSGVQTRSAIINFDFPYSFAYRNDDIVLGTILTKAIISISGKEKVKLNSKWLKEEK